MRPLYILYNVHKKGAVTLRQPLFPLFLHFVVFGFRSGGDFKRNPLFPDGRLDEQHDRRGHTQAYRRTKLFKIFLQLCVNTKTYTCLCDSRSPPSVVNRSLPYMKFTCQNEAGRQRAILSHLFPKRLLSTPVRSFKTEQFPRQPVVFWEQKKALSHEDSTFFSNQRLAVSR